MTKKYLRPFGFAMLLVKAVAARLPIHLIEAAVLTAINARADAASAKEGLRFLFRLDARLYEAQTRLARRLESGPHPKHRLTRYHDFFVSHIGPNERVLDAGCGYGQLAHDLATRCGATVDGVDISPDKIEEARRSFAHARLSFRVGDLLDGPSVGTYDTVVLSNVLEHLPGRPQFLNQLMQATQARRLLLRVPAFERDWRLPLKRELEVEWRADPTHETEHTFDELLAELTEAGLEIVEEKTRWGEILVVARPKEA